MSAMKPSALVVVGASAGGVGPLLDLAASLPADLPASVCIVLHVGAQRSILPQLLSSCGALPARHPADGEALRPGQVYVAPPDRHLLVDADRVRLFHGPRENHARPAIDPLFRSAAIHWGSRCIGVVLSGAMDDGSAGLAAIKASGGAALVQDPQTAFDPSMPHSAMARVAVDHKAEPAALGQFISQFVTICGSVPPGAVPEELVAEHAVFEGDRPMDQLARIGRPSGLTCPECGGALWELDPHRGLRFRCHTGHAYSALALDDAQQRDGDQVLAVAVRTLREREMLLRRMADVAQAIGDDQQAQAGRRQAGCVRAQRDALQELLRD